jgi:hypothetical protein
LVSSLQPIAATVNTGTASLPASAAARLLGHRSRTPQRMLWAWGRRWWWWWHVLPKSGLDFRGFRVLLVSPQSWLYHRRQAVSDRCTSLACPALSVLAAAPPTGWPAPSLLRDDDLTPCTR